MGRGGRVGARLPERNLPAYQICAGGRVEAASYGEMDVIGRRGGIVWMGLWRGLRLGL